MTITASFQSFSVSAMRLGVAARPSAATAPATISTATPAPPGDDTVTLSTATSAAPTTSETTATTPGTAPEAGQTQSSLFRALDANKDGAVTKGEFTSGAVALLGKRGAHVRVHGNGDGENGRRARGVPGLERRLERAFDRVDANDDGNVDEGEMSAALARRSGTTSDVPVPPAPPEVPQTGVSSFVRVTYVSVAIQRYSSLRAAAPSSTSPSAEAASAETVSTADAPPAA